MLNMLVKPFTDLAWSAWVLDVPPPPDMGNIIQQLAQQFTSMLSLVLTAVDSTVVTLARLAYVTTLLVGITLYFSHADKHLGKDLIKGGVILAVLSEFVFPVISKL
jgi:hypothetical protein